MEFNNQSIAFFLTSVAGIATCFGAFALFFIRKANLRFLSFALAFSAGVMVFLALAELLPEGYKKIAKTSSLNPKLITMIFFILGMIIILIIDKITGYFIDPHASQEQKKVSKVIKESKAQVNKKRLLKISALSSMAIILHNIPEGIVTFFSSIDNLQIGITVAFAIMLHNIPEGISIAVPIYCATRSKQKAILFTLIAAIAEPLGALIGCYVFIPYPELILGKILAFTAGIMIFLSFDELLPSAKRYSQRHEAIYGIIFGIIIVALSLVLI